MVKIKKRLRLFLVCLCVLTISTAVFTGCGEGKNVVLTAGLKKDEVFILSDKSCKLSEVMVYLTNMQNQYEKIYGEGIWNSQKTAESMQDQAKEQVLAQMAQIKAMVLLSENREVTLSEMEEDRAKAAGKEYYESLNEVEVSALKVDEETLVEMYREYALAQKVYDQIIGGVNPEISDDEARTITVLAIRSESREDAQSAWEQVNAEGADFAALAERLSEDTAITYSFGKGEADAAIEQAAFDLGKDEISDIIEAENGFYVIKCISTFDEAQTQANKVRIANKRRSEAFAQEYDAFVNTLPRKLNEELWATVELIGDEAVTTDTFFAVYDKYFTVE